MWKLFGHDPSPYVRRTRILLAELGVPFERDSHGWLDAVAEFEQASPIKRLPMLDRGAAAKTRYVFDSKVICGLAYQEAERTKTSAPAGDPPLQKTMWDAALEEDDVNVSSVIDSALDSAINLFLIEQDGLKRADSTYLRRQFSRTTEGLEWLATIYQGKTTLQPGSLAFVDISLVCALTWIRFRKLADVGAYPALVAVEKAHEARPSFAATFPYPR